MLSEFRCRHCCTVNVQSRPAGLQHNQRREKAGMEQDGIILHCLKRPSSIQGYNENLQHHIGERNILIRFFFFFFLEDYA